MSRMLRLVGLVAALMWAQWALAIHGIDHGMDAGHGHEDICMQCLALAGSSPVPVASDSQPEFAAAPVAVPLGVVPRRLTIAAPTYFLTRAPPLQG